MSELERTATAAAMLRDRGLLRLALHGTSMLPSIAEPMVLQIGGARHARIGDVLVFRDHDALVAHRIVAIAADGFRTAGDAQPHVVESVARAQVVGRVVAVWSDPSAARRVDDRAHRLRGWYYARFHGVRRVARIALHTTRYLLAHAPPRRRTRMAPRFVAAIAAIAREEPHALVAALDCDAEAIALFDRRHRCAAMFGEAARRAGVAHCLRPDVAAAVRRARVAAMLATERMTVAIDRTVRVLRAAGIEFALLKGAARVYAKAPGATAHPSDDIDILVRARDVDVAIRALEAAGWSARESLAARRRFRRHHHHAAPLFSPDGDYPVEIHHQLALPGTLSLDTSWDALRAHIVPLAGDAGVVAQLDRVGTALHLAIHAAGLARLRDIALLALTLGELRPEQRRMLGQIVATERRDPVRLAASLALAARAAGIAWSERAGVAAYVRWALRREDLPLALLGRADAADLVFARPDAPWSALHRLTPWWRRVQALLLPLHLAGACAAGMLAAVYAARLRESTLRLGDEAF